MERKIVLSRIEALAVHGAFLQHAETRRQALRVRDASLRIAFEAHGFDPTGREFEVLSGPDGYPAAVAYDDGAPTPDPAPTAPAAPSESTPTAVPTSPDAPTPTVVPVAATA